MTDESPTEAWEQFLTRAAKLRRDEALERSLGVTDPSSAPVVRRDGRELINLSSNNYLGLAGHPTLVAAVERAAKRGGGSGSSPLIAGRDASLAALEEKIAAFKSTESALVFGSGYLANVGTLASVLDRDSAVVSDQLNHASIIDGVRLSRASIHRYAHGDVEELENSLVEARRNGARRLLIVTDSVFSMDGDVAPLQDIVELKERHGAALMIDDAHGAGVFGPRGEGVAHHLGLGDRVEINMGTFSKAFGAYGAYVAVSKDWANHLVSTARTFIYSTALPPAVVGAVDASIDLVRGADELRRRLHARAADFRGHLLELGFDTGLSETQIVPAIVGDGELALEFAHELRDRGVLAVGIRPPTVPRGAARVRFSLMATHTDAQLDRALEIVEASGRKLGLISGL